MDIQLINKGPLQYVIVDNFYPQDQLLEIKEELDALKPFSGLSHTTGAAEGKKTGTSLIVDYHYLEDREKSKLLTYNRRIFNDDLVEKACTLNAFFKHIHLCDEDWTLLNYYNDGDKYNAHTDSCIITGLTFFKQGDFKGGDLQFNDFDETVPFVDNRLLLFPSCISHLTTPVEAAQGSYRVSVAQFLRYRT